MSQTNDEYFIKECFRLAERGKGHVSPNPLVGAVLVKKGRIVSRGFHRRFGGPHAEVECLRSHTGNIRGCSLYVNLEPCSHHGKTPPCSDLIIASGVKQVIVAMKDPNPRVAGKGIRKLRAAGVEVKLGVCAEQAKELNKQFIAHITKRRPFVHVKIAQTLDGRIALDKNKPTRITGMESRRLVHRWRAEHDAVLVGAGTINSDDPLLTVRSFSGRDPSVVILDRQLSVNENARVFQSARKRRIVIVMSTMFAMRKRKKLNRIRNKGVDIVQLNLLTSGRLLRPILSKLYQMNFGSLLVEGGAEVFGEFLGQRLVDELSVLEAPLLWGRGVSLLSPRGKEDPEAIELPKHTIRCSRIGRDSLRQYRFV